MYAMLCTRPGISYTLGIVSRYQNNLGIKHWSKHLKLCFQANTLEVIGFSDLDFAGDRDDCKSTSGHVFFFGGGAISW